MNGGSRPAASKPGLGNDWSSGPAAREECSEGHRTAGRTLLARGANAPLIVSSDSQEEQTTDLSRACKGNGYQPHLKRRSEMHVKTSSKPGDKPGGNR